MRLTTIGSPRSFASPIVGRIAVYDVPLQVRAEYIRLLSSTEHGVPDLQGYRAAISEHDFASDLPAVTKIRDAVTFQQDDVVALEPTGFVRSLFRPSEKHHSLFVTERCSSNCLMCSQPPKDVDDISALFARNQELLLLMKPKPEYLTITGGEPTLLGERFVKLIADAKSLLPDTEIHVLSNGRTLAFSEFCRRIANVEHSRLSFGIPLYSDYAGEHDYVVQAKGAFDQTVMGLHQAARFGIRLEIRVVLHKLTIPRLHRLAGYIYRNFPFVEHVALMGLEFVGYTARNIDKLWIDPFDYQEELERAVEYLSMREINVSIYNHQLCVLKRSLWPFAKKSISDWKNLYLPECRDCSRFEECGGMFQWAAKKHSAHIRSL